MNTNGPECPLTSEAVREGFALGAAATQQHRAAEGSESSGCRERHQTGGTGLRKPLPPALQMRPGWGSVGGCRRGCVDPWRLGLRLSGRSLISRPGCRRLTLGVVTLWVLALGATEFDNGNSRRRDQFTPCSEQLETQLERSGAAVFELRRSEQPEESAGGLVTGLKRKE